MSALRNVLKKKSGRVDGTVAVFIVGSALVFSGFNLANAASNEPASVPNVITVNGSAGQTITVSGSAGVNLP